MLGFSSFIRLRASVLLTGLVASMLLVTAVFAATEDVIYMSDGRELHGEIVSETDTTIVFEYMNPDLGISVPLTLVKSMILKIDRDVEVDAPVEPEAAPAASGTSSSSSSSTSKASAATPRERGEVASLYIIPMNGEIGTDIRSGIYEDIIEEIRETRPDIVIYHIDSKNTEDDMLSFWLGFTSDKDEWWKPDEFQRQESIQQLMDDEEKTVFNFHRQLPSSVRQVAWVRDATGPGGIPDPSHLTHATWQLTMEVEDGLLFVIHQLLDAFLPLELVRLPPLILVARESEPETEHVILSVLAVDVVDHDVGSGLPDLFDDVLVYARTDIRADFTVHRNDVQTGNLAPFPRRGS